MPRNKVELVPVRYTDAPQNSCAKQLHHRTAYPRNEVQSLGFQSSQNVICGSEVNPIEHVNTFAPSVCAYTFSLREKKQTAREIFQYFIFFLFCLTNTEVTWWVVRGQHLELEKYGLKFPALPFFTSCVMRQLYLSDALL